MTRPATIREADVRRAVRGALQGIVAAGLSPDKFQIIHRNGETLVLPAGASSASDEAAEMERRMQEAFGA